MWQAVEEKEMTLERMGSRSKWEKETVTLVPNIESVSSTAMVMQVQMNTMFKEHQTLCFSYYYKFMQFEQVKILNHSKQISSFYICFEHPIQGAL